MCMLTFQHKDQKSKTPRFQKLTPSPKSMSIFSIKNQKMTANVGKLNKSYKTFHLWKSATMGTNPLRFLGKTVTDSNTLLLLIFFNFYQLSNAWAGETPFTSAVRLASGYLTCKVQNTYKMHKIMHEYDTKRDDTMNESKTKFFTRL